MLVPVGVLVLAGALQGRPADKEYEGKTVREWIRTLRAEDPAARRAAAFVLARIGRGAQAALPALAKALADPDDGVRLYSARALATMGPAARPAIPSLAEALEEEKDPTCVALSPLPWPSWGSRPCRGWSRRWAATLTERQPTSAITPPRPCGRWARRPSGRSSPW
jgi:hypothetical protein